MKEKVKKKSLNLINYFYTSVQTRYAYFSLLHYNKIK